ncbi:MAG: transporter [Bacteroidota bacterium]
MNRLQVRLVVTLMFALSIGQIEGQIVSDRPDQTESSSTVGYGKLQIESGILIGFEGDDPISTRQILAPTTLFRYGITDGIEIRLISQFESLKTGAQKLQGISDLEIGAKIQIFKKEGSGSEIAFITHLVVPTGSVELSNDNFESINKLAVSHEINENMSLGYNFGYNYPGAGKGDLSYSLVLGIAVNEKVGIYSELYGELVNLENFIVNFDTGLTYLAKANLQFDLSFGTGINQRMNYISLGCCWKI